MSEEKRAQLIAEGKLNEDGSRKQACPTCRTVVGDVLTQEAYDETVGTAAVIETNGVDVTPGNVIAADEGSAS